MQGKYILAVFALTASFSAVADDGCSIPTATVARIQGLLPSAVAMSNGAILSPSREWSAIVDRQGRLCSAVSIGDALPYGRAMAIAKASTANGFSSSAFASSTANLYSQAQPGGLLYGFSDGNPFNPNYLANGTGIGRVVGGVISTAGGVALYQNGSVIGALGLAGDVACADHVMAYRMRRTAGFDAIPYGFGYNNTDNIDYLTPGQAPTGYKHPHCTANDIAPSQI